MEAQIRVERTHEVRVLFAIRKGSEDAVGELADVAFGAAEDKAVRAEVVEHRDDAVTVQRAPQDDGLLGLEKREVRAGRAALRTADAGRKRLVVVRFRKAGPEGLGVCSCIHVAGELAERRNDARA